MELLTHLILDGHYSGWTAMYVKLEAWPSYNTALNQPDQQTAEQLHSRTAKQTEAYNLRAIVCC